MLLKLILVAFGGLTIVLVSIIVKCVYMRCRDKDTRAIDVPIELKDWTAESPSDTPPHRRTSRSSPEAAQPRRPRYIPSSPWAPGAQAYAVALAEAEASAAAAAAAAADAEPRTDASTSAPASAEGSEASSSRGATAGGSGRRLSARPPAQLRSVPEAEHEHLPAVRQIAIGFSGMTCWELW